MPHRYADAACVESEPRPVTVPEATVIVIVLVLAAVLAVMGQPTVSVFVIAAQLMITRLLGAQTLATAAGA
ncbi:hypothetical protein [Streptomyces sp. NPDC050564]|uniref:hypothetical protein n=1 Tax=Streptomyces sp. NPDC050564 TaxID=3365631 RepID=UPI0037B0CD6E